MPERLTKALIEKAMKNRPEKETIIFDHEVRGFYVRVRAQGRPGFGFRYTENGKNRWLAIGLYGEFDVDGARDKAREHRQTYQSGKDPKATKKRAEDRTVQELYDRYITRHVERENKDSTARQVKCLLPLHVLPDLKDMKVREVQDTDVLDLLEEIESVYSANRTRAYLVKMFNKAEDWGWRDKRTNPVSIIKRRKGEKRRKRPVYPYEIQAFLKALDACEERFPEVVYLSKLLMLTGARRNEIQTRRRKDVDLIARRIKLPDSKTGEGFLELPEAAVELIKAYPYADSEEWLIPGKIKGTHFQKPHTAWYIILEAAKLEDFRFHDLRHMVGTYANAIGVDDKTIQDMLRHADGSMTDGYKQVFGTVKRKAFEKVAETLLGFKESPLLEGVTH